VIAQTAPQAVRLPAFSLFAALLAAAGLPIYLHAPKAYVDSYGVSLAALGAVLFGLRLLDVVQDPFFGRLAGRIQARGLAVALALGVMALSMLGLFAVTPPVAPLLWFAVTLAGVFSAYSFLTILFYAQGVATAARLGPSGHLQLARWRETGALIGVCLASIAPLVLGGFAGFALGFVGLCGLAYWAMRGQWSAVVQPDGGFAPVLRDPIARRLLVIALLNAAPVAVSSTLFLFFVESRLALPGWEGPLLLAFFLSAALAAPLWARAALRHGARRVLLSAMVLSIGAFGGALFLGQGDGWPFALICVASGAALGADMVLLPALFATRMAAIAPTATSGFGLWSFVSKATLAIAALLLLPALDLAGFTPGLSNSPQALGALSFAYAGLPCLLKAAAILLLARLREV
jgi:glycoside/pentoside/hexuronide:cation symporter, GPH family